MHNADGVLRVWRDVIGFRTNEGEYRVISNEAGVKGERLTIYLARAPHQSIPVRVLDSEPVILDGSLRHQLRLSSLDGEAAGPFGPTRDGDLEGE
jgi:hypothetical protein